MNQNITVTDIPYFKYAPVSSVDVERSLFKTILSDNGPGFTFENLKKIMTVQYNLNLFGKLDTNLVI